MDIQTIFYTLSSIFMILGIVVMVSMILLIWQIKNEAEIFKQKLGQKLSELMQARKFMGFVPLLGMMVKWVRDRKNA